MLCMRRCDASPGIRALISQAPVSVQVSDRAVLADAAMVQTNWTAAFQLALWARTRHRRRTRPRRRRCPWCRRRSHRRSRRRCGRGGRSCCCSSCRRRTSCRCRGWRWTRSAQSCYSQCISRTRSVGSDVAHDYHQRLPIVYINLERYIRIRAEA